MADETAWRFGGRMSPVPKGEPPTGEGSPTTSGLRCLDLQAKRGICEALRLDGSEEGPAKNRAVRGRSSVFKRSLKKRRE